MRNPHPCSSRFARSAIFGLVVLGALRGMFACTSFGATSESDAAADRPLEPDAPTDGQATAADGSLMNDSATDASDAGRPRTSYVAFVSVDTFTGDMREGTTLAHDHMDEYCTRVGRAAKGALPTSRFKAYLSFDSGADSRFVGGGPWHTPTGTFVFANQGELASGARAPLNEGPDGGVVPQAPGVWTGMNNLGGLEVNCNGWSTASTDQQGAFGLTTVDGGGWQHITRQACSTPSRVYCLEVP